MSHLRRYILRLTPDPPVQPNFPPITSKSLPSDAMLRREYIELVVASIRFSVGSFTLGDPKPCCRIGVFHGDITSGARGTIMFPWAETSLSNDLRHSTNFALSRQPFMPIMPLCACHTFNRSWWQEC